MPFRQITNMEEMIDYTLVKKEKIPLKPSQILKHEMPGIGLTLPNEEISELVVGLQQGGYGWQEVFLSTGPFCFGEIVIYDSHRDLGVDTPLPEQHKKASEKFDSTLKYLRTANFKLHIFPGGNIGLEETL